MGAEKQMVIFYLADVEFGLPVESIQEIVRPGAFVKVPLTPAYLLGLTNLRGNILPVVDLRLRLGLPARPTDEHTRLLVLCRAETKMCLLVDGVREVRSYTEDILEPPPDTGEDYGGFVHQVAKFDGGERVVFWLEEEKLFGEQVEGLREERGLNSFSSSQGEEKGSGLVSEVRLLSFRLGSEEYAFPIDRVREIIRYTVLRPLPEAPSFVKGLLTLRQRIVPVFDLRALLGLEPLAEEVSRRVEHLQELFSYQLLRLKEDPALGRKEILKSGGDFILPVWIEERLERSRYEKEFQLLKEVKQAWESFLKKVAEGGDHQPEAEKILEGLEGLKEILARSLPEEERIIILEENRRFFGLLVDRVEEVCSIPEASVEAPPEGEDLKGIAKLSGKRLIFILDEEVLIPQEELEELAEEEEEMVAEKAQEKARECQLVTFYLGEEEYGIPITRIQEINRVGKITRVPHTPDFVEGVTNLRGEIIPVIDLRKRLGLEERPLDDRTRLVIVQINGKKTGFIVDRVQEVARLQAEQLEAPPQMLETEIDLAFISSIAKLDGGRMIIVLDIDHILFPEEKEALKKMTGENEEESEEALFQIAE